ncbi:MAG: extracellular solute-binding protein [Acidimicrobiaceae bacterium]|nr:extracellular solute-binding protein [Acidimicrobiaceae bacterium]
MNRKAVLGASLGTLSLFLAACGSSSSSSGSGSATTAASVNWSSVTSASAGGGFNALVAAAKKEGHLNVVALPPGWANYGELISSFQQKYGITITSENPNGSSAEELAALTSEKGTSKEPDVVDVGPSFALLGAQKNLFAPYQVQEWNQIPTDAKAANGAWYFDYGGYISIGYNAGTFGANPPTSFASLLQPQYKGAVALDGNPTSAGAAFGAVYAAALANGGSLSNIQPGLTYFKQLAAAGNYVPVQSSPAVIESGQIKVNIDWDYLNAAYAAAVKGKVNWKVFVPSNAKYASYYAQAISANAPDPAAARLWEEYLYSSAGQNLWVKGFARPILLPAMQAAGTVNANYLKLLPAVTGEPTFPTSGELAQAQSLVATQWPNVAG